MNKLVPIGRIFFALAFIALGVDHFVFREFVTARAPAWPASVPGGVAWAYLTGVVFVVIGMAILTGKKARLAAISASALIFVWALLRHLPIVATDPFLSPAWTQTGKALWFVGGLLAIAATFPAIDSDGDTSLWRFVNRKEAFITVGHVCLGLFLVITGVQHFLYTEFVASLIPTWFPGDAVFWTYFAGVALVAGGLGLFIPQTARLAALLAGLMVFSWFWIVHVAREIAGVADGIAVFEALATSGLLFVIAGALYNQETLSNENQPPNEESNA